jgi:hypothetical protein
MAESTKDYYKYILVHPDGKFERVYPTSLEEKKHILGTKRISMTGNLDRDLVFIFSEVMFGLELNFVATQLADTNLYGSVLIEDREDRFCNICT